MIQEILDQVLLTVTTEGRRKLIEQWLTANPTYLSELRAKHNLTFTGIPRIKRQHFGTVHAHSMENGGIPATDLAVAVLCGYAELERRTSTDPTIVSLGRFLRNPKFDSWPKTIKLESKDAMTLGHILQQVNDFNGFDNRGLHKALKTHPGLLERIRTSAGLSTWEITGWDGRKYRRRTVEALESGTSLTLLTDIVKGLLYTYLLIANSTATKVRDTIPIKEAQ